MDLSLLPNELLTEVLFRVDHQTLIRSCPLVSRSWQLLIQSEGFWKRYHRFWCDKLGHRALDSIFESLPWWFFAQLNPQRNFYEKNLLRNCSAELVSNEEVELQDHRIFIDGSIEPWPKYPHWKICSSGGDGWKVEKPPDGGMFDLPIIQSQSSTEGPLSLPGYFVSSFHSCSKEQTIDLQEFGFSPEVVDATELTFDITVEEWFSMTGPGLKEMSVACLDSDKETVSEHSIRRRFEDVEHMAGVWKKDSLSVEDISLIGVRYLRFYHGGTGAGVIFQNDDGELIEIDIKVKIGGCSLKISFPKFTHLDSDHLIPNIDQ